jgi:hypothetical protein
MKNIKNRKSGVVTAVGLLILVTVLIAIGDRKVESVASLGLDQPNLSIKMLPANSDYVQGEVVGFDIEITNNGESDVFLRGWDVRSGFVKIFISTQNQQFKQYSHSAWIRGRQGGKSIKPGENIKSQGTLLWNFSPSKRFVNPNSFKDSYVMTDLAFPEPGIYLIKAILVVPGESATNIESDPVQIVVNEPQGDDLTVWHKIRNNDEIAYFAQEGEIRSPKSEEREKLLKEIDLIIANYPNSSLAGQIRQSLGKFRVNEAKRTELLEKLRQPAEHSN